MIKDETENIDLNGNFIMTPLISLLAENALGLTITEGSEMDQGSVIDKLIKDPLTTLSEKDDNIEISMARNLTDNSTATTKKSCPDFSVWLERKILIFKGEEKRYVEDFDETVNELESKMKIWNVLFYGDVPYILAYAAAGYRLGFFAINNKKELIKISKRFRLTDPKDRLQILKCVINIYRIIATLKKFVPKYFIRLYENIYQPHETVVQIHDSFIVKTINNYSTFINGDFDIMKALYKDTADIANLIHSCDKCGKPDLPTLFRKKYKVTLAPLGYRFNPTEESELKTAIQTVLEVIRDMHSIGYVHRDLRWPNVLQQVDGKWLVIDLEHGGRLDVAPGFGPLSNWPPQATENNEYRQEYDVYQVGKMMADCIFMKSDLCKDLQKRLLEAPQISLTAVEALKDKWFLH
ncbi:9302_t:CDS:1 [Entrophospora sp. SA101]|nr:9302_t:CDS:1 [Entrophospora sp. SA101]CAJ0850351.1 5415_t:CDS:1 [Entrophospora sp. SA101]